MRKSGICVFVLLFCAALLTGCGNNGYKIGQEIKESGVTFKVVDIRFTDEITWSSDAAIEANKPEGYIWAIIDLDVTNTTGETIADPIPFFLDILGSDGQKYSSPDLVVTGGPYDFIYVRGLSDLAPGATVRATALVGVPSGASLSKLVFKDVLKEETRIEVDLGNVAAEVPPAPEPVKMGEPLDVNGLQMTVYGKNYSSGYSYSDGVLGWTYTPKAGYTLLELDIGIKNVSNPNSWDLGLMPILGNAGMVIVDADGKYYVANQDYFTTIYHEYMFPQPNWWDVGELNTGDEQRAHLVFTVPQDAKSLKLWFQEPVLGPPAMVSLTQ